MRSKAVGSLGLCGAFLALATGAGARGTATPAPAAAPNSASAASAPPSASLTLGGELILTLRSSAGGMTPQQRIDVIDGRISNLLGTPHIKPSDVAVYTPAGKAPVIYALGRRLITVDAATAADAGNGRKPLDLAKVWAEKLQQTLPRVDWRPSNEAEPVIPANPSLIVTSDLSKVGGNVGLVTLRDKVVFKISGPQPAGMTAQERADILSKRLQRVANKMPGISAGDITVAPMESAKPASASDNAAATHAKDSAAANIPEEILIGTTPVITIDAQQATDSGYKSPKLLANSWAKNVRTALGLDATAAPVAQSPAAPAPAEAKPPVSTTAPAPAANGGG